MWQKGQGMWTEIMTSASPLETIKGRKVDDLEIPCNSQPFGSYHRGSNVESHNRTSLYVQREIDVYTL